MAIQGSDGLLTLPVEQLFLSPGQDIRHMHRLRAGQVLTEVRLRQEPRRRSAFVKYAKRKSWDFALTNAAVALVMAGNYVERCRIVFGGVAAMPWRSRAAETSLDGKRLTEEAINTAAEVALTGGGLIRSAGGWVVLKSAREGRDQTTGDERILGEGEFVESVLKEAEENIERRQRLQAQGYDFQKVVSRAGELIGLNVEEVIKPGKQPQRVQARSLVCYWAVIELGLVGTLVAKMLGMSQPAVSKAVQRGGRLAADKGYTLRGKL